MGLPLAQTPEVDAIGPALDTHSKIVAEISKQLNDGAASDPDLESSLRTLNIFLDDAARDTALLQDALAKPTDQLEQLGPPPAEDQPPESADIATMRQSLTDQVNRLNGLSKRVVLAGSTANHLIGQARNLQRLRLISQIQARGPSPFSGQLWIAAGARSCRR